MLYGANGIQEQSHGVEASSASPWPFPHPCGAANSLHPPLGLLWSVPVSPRPASLFVPHGTPRCCSPHPRPRAALHGRRGSPNSPSHPNSPRTTLPRGRFPPGVLAATYFSQATSSSVLKVKARAPAQRSCPHLRAHPSATISGFSGFWNPVNAPSFFSALRPLPPSPSKVSLWVSLCENVSAAIFHLRLSHP